MDKYIKLKDVFHILDIVMNDEGVEKKGKAIRKRLKALPGADAVEVVRCKNCEYLFFDTEYCREHNEGYCFFDNTIKPNNHFCSYGEKKEGAE